MENKFKEIEEQCRQSLELWSDVLTHSNESGWGVNLDFTQKDIHNAVDIMISVCTNFAIKNGAIKSSDDAERIGNRFKEFMMENFKIDTTKTE